MLLLALCQKLYVFIIIIVVVVVVVVVVFAINNYKHKPSMSPNGLLPLSSFSRLLVFNTQLKKAKGNKQTNKQTNKEDKKVE